LPLHDWLGPAYRRFVRDMIADEVSHYAEFLELAAREFAPRLAARLRNSDLSLGSHEAPGCVARTPKSPPQWGGTCRLARRSVETNRWAAVF
jgi:hypothetical protein